MRSILSTQSHMWHLDMGLDKVLTCGGHLVIVIRQVIEYN